MIKNRIPLILLLNAAGIALFCSWYLPVNHGFWAPLDAAIFYFFNHLVGVNTAYTWLLAVINNRAFDACSLLAMGSLMLSFWFKEQSAGRRRVIIIGLVKRASPSLSFTDITKVSDVISFPTKDASKDSFPGDHGMMLLIFASFMWRYFGRRAFAIALVIFVVFAFPRVMIGAHWFTDIAVGSLTAVLIGAPWVLMTPLSDKVITLFERYLPGGRTKI